MAHQLTVRLPDDLGEALDSASKALRQARAEIVRRALRRFLEAPEAESRPADRVGHLLGSLDSGVSDLGENHRAYVLESLKRESS